MREIFYLVGVCILILFGIFKVAEPLEKNDQLMQGYVDMLSNEGTDHEAFLERLTADLVDAEFDVSSVLKSLEVCQVLKDSSIELFVIEADFLTKSKSYEIMISTQMDDKKQLLVEFYIRTKQVNDKVKISYMSSQYSIR